MRFSRAVIFWWLLIIPWYVHAYNSAGSDSTIDILTWNIEQFPKQGQNTIDEIAQIIRDLQSDLFAVQEIADSSAFLTLLAQLPGWEGLLSPHRYNDGSYQKIGIIYDTTKIEVNWWQLLFTDDSYAFPRPPLEVAITAQEGGHTFTFRMIIVHLKAYDDQESENRRKEAINQLKTYIDQQLDQGGEQDFILLGDFNDHLEDPPEDNVFQPLLDDSATYTFLTEPLVGIQGSYIGYNEPNLIDHLCVTNDALTEYGDNGSCEVLYLDDQNTSYEQLVSDHRPVIGRFAFDNDSTPTQYIPIAQIHENFEQYKGTVVTVKGVVTIAAGIFSSSFTDAYIQDSSNTGINIYQADSVVTALQRGREVAITGEVAEYKGRHEIKYHSHKVMSENQPLPTAWSISTASINQTDQDPGRWVTVAGEIESISDPPHVTMTINDGSGSGKVYFDPDANLDVSEFSVGDHIRVNGVKTVYNYEGQVQPGYQEDIQKEGTSIVADQQPHYPLQPFMTAYPNPVFLKENTTIHVLLGGGQAQMAYFRIIDLQGRVIQKGAWPLVARGINHFKIGVNNRFLASGFYIVEAVIGHSRLQKKILLVR